MYTKRNDQEIGNENAPKSYISSSVQMNSRLLAWLDLYVIVGIGVDKYLTEKTSQCFKG